MLEQLFLTDQSAEPIHLQTALLSMLLAFVCGQVVAWTYMATHTGLSYSRTYVNALVVIPFLVSTVMMVLSNNLVTAFGLMALFAIVRFRNILRDTLDTCYILSCITLGMACGTGRYGTAVAGLVLLCGILVYLAYTSFGSRQRYDVILNLRWSRPLNELAELQRFFRRHTTSVVCASQRVGEDSGVDLSYRLQLRDSERMNDLLQEARAMQGVTRVTGMAAQDESEL
jgi:hypothetical protein